VKPPAPQEVERWYAQHGRSLFGVPDSSKAWFPPLTDSLRAVVAARWVSEQRERMAGEAMGRIVPALRTARDARAAAKSSGAVAETLSLIMTSAPDSLFSVAFVDSLLAAAAASKGALQGPRAFGRYWSVWRVDAVDTSHVPPYEAVRARSDQEFAADRRAREEAEGRAWFEQHREDFKTSVRYALDCVGVQIPPADSVRITDAEIRRRYDANQDAYRQDEQVKVRHIVFMTRDSGKDIEQRAKTRADSLLAAIRKDGGDFVELAKRFSEEPGAASSGGDLGWFGRGAMVKEFETAAFALKPDEISPVVKTQFGYHIIKLEDRRAAGMKPFEDVRGEIRTQIAQARGDSTARRSAGALRRRLALGGDAKLLAARYGGVAALSPIAPNDPLPGFGAAQGLAQALPVMKPGTWAPDVYRAGARYLVVRMRERIPPQPAGFEESKTQAIEAMKNARRRAALDGKVAAIRSSLAAGATLDSLAAPYGGLKDSGPLGQVTGFVPLLGNEPRVVKQAFAMAPGAVSDTLQVAQGVLWMRAEEKIAADPVALKAASAQMEAELTKQRYDEWLESRKNTIRIEILRADLKGPRPPTTRTATVSAGG
jgi:parvulin-like peptidyl-prolyl isomerase